MGRNELVSLPDLQFFDIDAKIDTGAYSCSIHCDDIRLSDDNRKVHFRLLDESHPDYHDKEIVMPVSEIRQVKSSNGTTQERIFIKTLLQLFSLDFETELSLTDRKSMKYPMLIGRKFLEDRFIVDVSLNYESSIKQKA
ncbi:MAG: RimK/LysX family protein [Helicobacteraceae bacterium]|nr:RimK/LysX family protein [Helicobacteraceae bacterium]